MKKFCVVGISLVYLMFISGCIIVADNDFKEPDKCGIPKEARRVGSGFEIFYNVQEDGIITLVDRKSCKSLMSRYVPTETKYEFFAATVDPKTLKQWGIDVKKADFVLYFLPTQPKPPIPAKHISPPKPPVPPTPPVPPVPPLPPQS